MKSIFNKISLIFVVLPILLFAGCGGGGGSSDANVPSSSNVLANEDATGVWDGTITQDGVGTFDATGLVSGNQLRFISIDGGAIYEGTISVNGSSFTANTTNYQIGGTVFSTSTLTGTISTANSISGTFTSSDGATGSFSFNYDNITDRGSSLATTDANWTVTSGGVTTTISIDSSGLLTGSDTTGCIYNGNVSIIDANVNIYSVTITASSCGIYNGAYAGYGVVGDDATTNDTLIYTVSNSNFILVGFLSRV